MKPGSCIRQFCLVLLCAAFLTACGAAAHKAAEESRTVQDLEPGQKSMIEAPDTSSQSSEPVIKERNI